MKKNSEQAKVLTDKELEGVSGGRAVLKAGLTEKKADLASAKTGQVVGQVVDLAAKAPAKTGIIIVR